MDNLLEVDSRIKVLHIESLPSGWLGKNHALYQGAIAANGQLLLFTDGDIRFHKEVIARAVTALKTEKVSHLTITPTLVAKTFWLKAFVGFFLFGFSYYKRPWKANDSDSSIGIGIGAFNLMTRDAYEEIGTHESIKNRPDDDLQIGTLIKKHGLEQRIITGLPYLSVEWYQSLRSALIGLEKNTFAGLHYRLTMVFVSVVGVFLSQVYPFLTLFNVDKFIFFLSVLNVLFIAFNFVAVTRKMTNFSPYFFFVLPITAVLFIYSIIRATILTFIRGGVIWRGTKYSLHDLRRQNGE
ncbi:cellulose synthase/poly-beta-1,6-N-acetylglucosamine synthase-like glycosyltransferase [Bacillus pakistanensis]|uniref:Cellulose synthase/poly-beta-1,6-N-acetylglucosamine synthase-like glycosyltransferase n=2 Tax=Rossellomorea pakistanensis TaxID=992288 RepID=A0ABS2NAC7_9BACI|nr:cellulose synthase/poly-beta-1,6-N-acetylglucosamine synthase-like glycosyltransferase [Bacillus pakistanensis]